MSTPGTDTDFIVIADSDALIALLNEEDSNFAVARDTVKELVRRDAQVVFPLTAIVETVTTLQRRLKQPRLAASVIEQVVSQEVEVDPVDESLLKQALALFDLAGSKKNTLFDALVAATAQKRKTHVIFSFDRWYKKKGFTLASEYVLPSEKAA